MLMDGGWVQREDVEQIGHSKTPSYLLIFILCAGRRGLEVVVVAMTMPSGLVSVVAGAERRKRSSGGMISSYFCSGLKQMYISLKHPKQTLWPHDIVTGFEMIWEHQVHCKTWKRGWVGVCGSI